MKNLFIVSRAHHCDEVTTNEKKKLCVILFFSLSQIRFFFSFIGVVNQYEFDSTHIHTQSHWTFTCFFFPPNSMIFFRWIFAWRLLKCKLWSISQETLQVQANPTGNRSETNAGELENCVEVLLLQETIEQFCSTADDNRKTLHFLSRCIQSNWMISIECKSLYIPWCM